MEERRSLRCRKVLVTELRVGLAFVLYQRSEAVVTVAILSTSSCCEKGDRCHTVNKETHLE